MRAAIVAVILMGLSILPPIKQQVSLTLNANLWAWIVMAMGIASFAMMYLRVNVLIRLWILALYFNCFYSQLPIISLVSYFNFLAAMVFLVICLRMRPEEFTSVNKAFPVMILMQAFFFLLQMQNKDFVLNALNIKDIVSGTVGNPMMMGSMVIALAAPLCLNRKWFILLPIVMVLILNKSTATIPLLAGIAFYLMFKIRRGYAKAIIASAAAVLIVLCIARGGELKQFDYGGRVPVWKRTIEMAKDRPIRGWGIGSYKFLIPINTKDIAGGLTNDWVKGGQSWKIGKIEGNWLIWNRAHNDPLQLHYEVGYPGDALLLITIILMAWRFVISRKTDEVLIITSGLIAIFLNSLGAFPSKMTQVVPIIIYSIACFMVLTKENRYGQRLG